MVAVMDYDPKKLIHESFNIRDISERECRSIFFGWALDLEENLDPLVGISMLLEKYAEDNPNHPMTKVLKEGYSTPGVRKKRMKK